MDKRKEDEMADEIQRARKTMRDAFKADEYFKRVYVANIAMYLHDHHGVTDYKERNAAGEGILKLIFE